MSINQVLNELDLKENKFDIAIISEAKINVTFLL